MRTRRTTLFPPFPSLSTFFFFFNTLIAMDAIILTVSWIIRNHFRCVVSGCGTADAAGVGLDSPNRNKVAFATHEHEFVYTVWGIWLKGGLVLFLWFFPP